ncbi:response regulator transcription factor [Paeniglutamicibacter kerguelensis]|uniref:Two-component system OmpR family response regulator n=1 Tax=Paeniglutamicibacter kerguelensis TaxID=254788 RepID=A0ABS4XLE7_9MICC|nr:response regulator transcription factor [Paeniglutamicibacter kerguelensis]MBP2388509.1 two-component system OmpR family response regulator [Paeniglutamicibacter kerguelensis]
MPASRFSPTQLPRLTHPDGTPIRVLVVDDEPSLAELVSMGTRMLGWEATVAHDGPSAVKAARTSNPDVLVLDWMLPGFEGPEVLRKVRMYLPEVPVLFLTAKDAVEDRIEGLGIGADDYVAKPFSLEEVLLRLHKLVERSGASAADTAELVVGDLVLNTDSHDVTRAGVPINLTATEFDLLSYLMLNARRVVSKAQILDNVWHYDFGGQANIVELYISYLRKKIEADWPPMIHTVRGAGYMLKPAQ